LAQTLNNLGTLYHNTRRFAAAEAVYVEARDIRRKLVEALPAVYSADLAQTLVNLGKLYWQTDRGAEAAETFIELQKVGQTEGSEGSNKRVGTAD
jgi:hypothetical protein